MIDHKVSHLMNLDELLSENYDGFKGSQSIVEGNIRIITKFISGTESVYDRSCTFIKSLTKAARNIYDINPEKINPHISKLITFCGEGLVKSQHRKSNSISALQVLVSHLIGDTASIYQMKFERDGEISDLVNSAKLDFASALALSNDNKHEKRDIDYLYMKRKCSISASKFRDASEKYIDTVTKLDCLANGREALFHGRDILTMDKFLNMSYSKELVKITLDIYESLKNLKPKEMKRVNNSVSSVSYPLQLANACEKYLEVCSDSGFSLTHPLKFVVDVVQGLNKSSFTYNDPQAREGVRRIVNTLLTYKDENYPFPNWMSNYSQG